MPTEVVTAVDPAPEGNSLEGVAGEPQATPGLQQLARIFPIQLQVLNGVDDLGMHVPDWTQRRGALWEKRGMEKEQDRNSTPMMLLDKTKPATKKEKNPHGHEGV